jgi:membrane protein insertase Oxa1/YidC/SpoIIIJ
MEAHQRKLLKMQEKIAEEEERKNKARLEFQKRHRYSPSKNFRPRTLIGPFGEMLLRDFKILNRYEIQDIIRL